MPHPWLRLKGLGEALQPKTGDPGERQWRWLQSCLERNAGCTFGQQHDFAGIRTIDQFQQRVSLSGYEDYAASIARIAEGEPDVLFAGRALAFERTGGSTSGGKLIPYTEASLGDFRRAILPWLANLVSDYSICRGSAYWAISPALNRHEVTPGGIPVGLPDGSYLGDEATALFAELSAVPPWVGEIANHDQWLLATLYHLLVRSDLALISVWSPTFLLILLNALEQRSDALLAMLRDGTSIAGHAVPANPPAHARLRQYLATRDTRTLWPELALVSAWADGASRPYFTELERRLPQACFQPKGLLATEGVVTVPSRDGRAILATDSGFFEFLDTAGTLHLAQELSDGQCYEVVMTTSGGLYRYRTGDRVRCEGHTSGLPHLRFTGRCGLASDLVGEKLNEDFVARCLADIDGFRMLVPVSGEARGYALVVDSQQSLDLSRLAQQTEQRLSDNPQYAYARKLGQLRAVRVVPARQPLHAYLERMAKRGMLAGNVKVSALRPEPDWLATFGGH